MKKTSDFLTFLLQMQGRRVLHLGHKDADCDALGSAYAMSRLLPGDIGFSQGLKITAYDLATWLGVCPVVDPDPSDYEYTIIYDCYFPELLASTLPKHFALFDHHTSGGRRLVNIHNQLAEKADWSWVWPVDSTCSIIARLLIENEISFDSQMAIALAAGIITDTFMLKIANAESFQLLADILGCHDQYFEDVLAVINPSERVAVRREAVVDAIKNLKEVKIGPWSILALHTDSHDHGLILFNILNQLGGDANLVSFPKGQIDGYRVNMVMAECEHYFAQQTRLHLGALMRAAAREVNVVDTWGTQRVGRIIATDPEDLLLNVCLNTLIQALDGSQ